ncbi:cyclin-like protein [Vararia minispora EC-137]|uniref:Cyclin-like protein n=1 Tax=Vararia minispora EC-137 TaxID=1314806 RepID=A0ACB8QJG3_9AGAM|nr:cyclin-like protein [Vararia minispora EC-137]
MDDASVASNGRWLFSTSQLEQTPTSLDRSVHEEMYDRARGVEFLFRVGSHINMHLPGMFTAATWFHRFYMRYSMDDYHRQNVAASCIFLATKTEECGRKLRDVAKVVCAKVHNNSMDSVSDGKEVDEISRAILMTEEVLLEALCFDFVVDSPHFDLVSLFETYEVPQAVQDHALSIANDSYRTPLCVLYMPKTIAAACYILAHRLVDGPHSLSLDARVFPTLATASLPTPPTHQSNSPNASKAAVEFFRLDAADGQDVIDAMDILIEFYRHTDYQGLVDYLSDIILIEPPSNPSPRPSLYKQAPQSSQHAMQVSTVVNSGHATPESLHGSGTPFPMRTKTFGLDEDAGPGQLDLS